MKDVFISYSSKDFDEANRICKMLEQSGRKCFISSRDLIPGEEYASQLLFNLDNSKSVVFLLSRFSNESPHVLREIEYAVGHKIPIMVYALEEVELNKSLEYFLMTHQWITRTQSQDEKLLEGLAYLIDGKDKSAGRKASKKVGYADVDNSYASAKKNKKKNVLIIVLAVVLGVVIITFAIYLIYSKLHSGNAKLSHKKQIPRLGDEVIFGKYYNEPISWRVIKENSDGSLVLLADDIVAMKVFDAAESGEYNVYDGEDYWSYEKHNVEDERLLVLLRGNNDWSVSNIRTWLNSDKEIVVYSDQAPTKKAVGDSAYSSEPGFLSGFSEEEISAIIPTKNASPANTFSADSQNGLVWSTDYVYLLSSGEINWLTEADVHIFAGLTDACISNANGIDEYMYFARDYSAHGYYYWWLRDNDGEAINKVYAVTTDVDEDRFISASVGAMTCGVRPAVTVDPQSDSVKLLEE